MSAKVVKPNDSKRFLFTLIKSMTKGEKRSFKLYVNRNQNTGDLKIVQLFDVMDKMNDLDDSIILKKMLITPSQLSNLKRHLYQQVLSSLRLVFIQKNIDIEIREQIDFARILYGKGLYFQSLRILERIRIIAAENHQNHLHLEILEFLKLIEERHVTRSRQTPGKMEKLEKDAEELSLVLYNSSRLSNLKIAIHGYYIQHGHVKSETDAEKVKATFELKLEQIQNEELTFFEKVYLYQSYVWYHHILLDFKSCFEYAKKWVEMFAYSPHLIDEDPDLYIRGYHYALTALYNDGDEFFFKDYLQQFEYFIKKRFTSFNENTQLLVFLYLNNARLNHCFLTKKIESGTRLVAEIQAGIEQYGAWLDPHRVFVFNYKIAYLYFGLRNFDRCQDFLLEILDTKISYLREDLQSYARIMQLIVHYELENYNLLGSLVKSAYRFLEKSKQLSETQKLTLDLFKKLVTLPKSDHRPLLEAFKTDLAPLLSSPYEKRSFLYLDVHAWVNGHLEDSNLA